MMKYFSYLSLCVNQPLILSFDLAVYFITTDNMHKAKYL